MPLDEYYYGKMEGDPTYSEDKAEFRFKVCLLMFMSPTFSSFNCMKNVSVYNDQC